MRAPLSIEQKAQRAAYVKTWHAQNRERVREIKRAYRERNREALRDKNRSAYHSDLERSRADAREKARRHYHSKIVGNREKANENLRVWYRRNAGKIRPLKNERTRHWKRNNRDKVAADSAKRRAWKRVGATDASDAMIKGVYAMAKRLTVCTGIPHEVDHIVPLAAGGRHHEGNLQVLTETLNRRKGAK